MANRVCSYTELRPCYVTKWGLVNRTWSKIGEEKALFHTWSHVSEIHAPSLLKGGHSGGTVSNTFGIVEGPDGKVYKAYPSDIRFCDREIEKYAFPEDSTNDMSTM